MPTLSQGKSEPHKIPPELFAPPRDAPGWIAFQPSTGNIWRKVSGEWLRISEAMSEIEAGKNSK